jgi:putative endonuclease
MDEYAYVYILASGFKKLYIGITTELEVRVGQHKQKKDPNCHTARYNINQLVHFERFTTVPAAIKREKQLKGWLRIRKIELIVSNNPDWRDLSADWGKPIEPYKEG